MIVDIFLNCVNKLTKHYFFHPIKSTNKRNLQKKKNSLVFIMQIFWQLTYNYSPIPFVTEPFFYFTLGKE